MKTKTTHITKTPETVKTPKISCTWKRGVCAAIACLLLGLTACSAKTPATPNAAPGAAADGKTAAVQTLNNEDLAAAKPVDIRLDATSAQQTTTPEAPKPAETEAPAPETTEAVPAPSSGKCGEQMTWECDTEFGFLTIEGSGEMTDFDKPEDAPWYPHRALITSVYLVDGITTIGSNAFVGCDDAVFNFPETLTCIGSNAFDGCKHIESLTLSGKLSKIGSGAFRNCTGLRVVVSTDDRDQLDMDLFGGCTGLQEIWILNSDCELSGKPDEGNHVTICGLPGSTAERYAQENGYTFNAMTNDREKISRLMAQDADPDMDGEFEADGVSYRTNSSLHFNGIVKVGDRYLSQILRSQRVSATEEEISQARANGVMVVDGVEYVYTESADQVKQYLGYDIEWSDYQADAWIYRENAARKTVYKVRPENGAYTFLRAGVYEQSYITSYQPCAWFWMDAGSPFSMNGYIVSLEDVALAYGYVRNGDYAYAQQLLERGDGELLLFNRSSGKK